MTPYAPPLKVYALRSKPEEAPTYTLPDGTVVTLQNEHVRMNEAMFQPALAGCRGHGLADILWETIHVRTHSHFCFPVCFYFSLSLFLFVCILICPFFVCVFLKKKNSECTANLFDTCHLFNFTVTITVLYSFLFCLWFFVFRYIFWYSFLKSPAGLPF